MTCSSATSDSSSYYMLCSFIPTLPLGELILDFLSARGVMLASSSSTTLLFITELLATDIGLFYRDWFIIDYESSGSDGISSSVSSLGLRLAVNANPTGATAGTTEALIFLLLLAVTISDFRDIACC